jgi:tetratricopeptide (TPR) repeat protein
MADAALSPGVLAGRDRELAALREWRAEALAGRGRLVVLTGPPGIGKTRLAEELADGARRDGQRVLWGRAVEERGAPPLWPWRRILDAVGGAERDGLTGDRGSDSARSDDLAAARFRAAAAAADALTTAAATADLLIVLEDLHWADHASLFLLRELAAELPGSRLLVLATCREGAGDPWRAALGDLARLPGLQVMRLAPLGEAAVDEMLQTAGVAGDPDLVRFVHARSEGNPLYVATLARVLAAEPRAGYDANAVARIAGGSAEVSHLVSSLSDGLDDGARDLLAAASVLGTEFGSSLAAAVCGDGTDVTAAPAAALTVAALAAAEAKGLVTGLPNRPGTWRFTHALVRDGIYASLRDDRRIALHGRAAAALEPVAREAPALTGQPLAAVLAHSWRIDAAYQLLNLQAVDAEIGGIAQLASSTRLPLARWHLLRQQASRAALAGQLAVARDRSEEARRLAIRLQDPSGAGLSYVFAIWLALTRGDAAEVPADVFDVIAAGPPIPVVRAALAMALFAVGRTDEAQAVYETLRQLLAAGDRDVRTVGAFLQLIELIIAFRDTETARACYDLFGPRSTQAGAVGTGLVVMFGSPHWPLGRLTDLLGQTEQALDHFAQAAAVNTRLGARPLVVLTRLDWAATLHRRASGSDLTQARVLARQAAAEARRLDMPGPADRGDRLARELEQATAAANPLTRREREIAGLVSDGLNQPGDRGPAGLVRADRRGAHPEHSGQAAADQPDRTRGLGAARGRLLTRVPAAGRGIRPMLRRETIRPRT